MLLDAVAISLPKFQISTFCFCRERERERERERGELIKFYLSKLATQRCGAGPFIFFSLKKC